MPLRPVVLFLLPFIVACSDGWPDQEPQPFPPGVYRLTLSDAEVPAEVPSDIRPLMVGTFVVTFSPDGRVRNMVNGQLDAEGHYASTPGFLVLTDETGQGHCTKDHATGIYRWTREGEQFRLESVEDRCRWREFAITRKPWTRSAS